MAAKDGVNASDICLGVYPVTDLSTAQPLPSIPGEARFAEVAVEGQNVRYREDGVDPTSEVGMPLGAGVVKTFETDINGLSRVRIIEMTPSAKITVTYFK